MDESTYTLPGVMQFMRAEWQKRERQTIEWELEKAQMKSALAAAQQDRRRLQLERDGLKTEVGMLVAKLRGKQPPEEASGPAGGPEEPLGGTIATARAFLAECVGDIKAILQTAGALSTIDGRDDTDELYTATSCRVVGAQARSLAYLPGRRLAAAASQLTLYTPDLEPVAVDEKLPLGAMSCFAAYSSRLLVAGSGELRVYAAGDKEAATLELLHTQPLEVDQLAASAASSLVLAVDAEGACVCYTLPKDAHELKALCALGPAVRACFAAIDGEPVAVLAQHSESPDGESLNGVLLLLDPISGDTQRKIVFGIATRVTALVCVGEYVVVGTANGDLLSFSLLRGDIQTEFHSAHRAEIVALAAADNDTLVSAGADGRVCVWSVPALGWRGRFYSHDSAYGVRSIAVADGALAVAGGDAIIRVYAL